MDLGGVTTMLVYRTIALLFSFDGDLTIETVAAEIYAIWRAGPEPQRRRVVVRGFLYPLLDVLLLKIPRLRDGGRISRVRSPQVEVMRAFGNDQGYDGLGNRSEDAT